MARRSDPEDIQDREELLKALRQLYDDRGLSRHDFAEASSLGTATVQAILNGSTGIPQPGTLKAFAKACGEDPDAWLAARRRAVKAQKNAEALRGPVYLPVQAGRSFVGRERELEALDDALTGPSSAGGTGTLVVQQRVGTVHGLGGIGKSALAAHWAAARLDEHAATWWITADTPAHVTQGLAALGAALDESLADRSLEVLAEHALGWLAAHRGWLLVLDNVVDPADVEQLLARVRTGRIVVTTRTATGWDRLTGHVLRLDVLTQAQAVDLLTRIVTGVRPNAALDGAAELAEELGQLPLALRQAAGFIAETGMTPAAYLDLLARYPASTYGQAPADTPVDRTIARVWHATLDHLRVSTPLAGHLLRVLAWYAPDRIPRSLLDPGLSPDGARAPADPVMVHAAVARLAAYNMITQDEDGRTLSVHRLVQALARTPDEADPHRKPGDVARARAEAAGLLCTAVLPDVEDPAVWAALRSLVPHADALTDRVDAGGDLSIYVICSRVGNFLRGQGLLNRAITYLQRSLDVAEHLTDSDHFLTMHARTDLGLAYRDTSEPERAVPLLLQNVLDCERLLGDDHPDTLSSRHNLAYAYQKLGDLEQAVPLHEQTLAARERVLGEDHFQTLISRNNLALAYAEAGQPERALPLHERNLADRRRILGEDHSHTLSSGNNLASVYEKIGDLERAVALYEETLAGYVRTLGEDHPDALAAKGNLAYAYENAGNPEQAVALGEEALAGCERALDVDHPLTLRIRVSLAHAYEAVGDLKRAIQLQEHVVDEHARRSGDDHIDTLVARSNLGHFYKSSGDAQRAVSVYEAAVAGLSRTCGDDDPNTVGARSNLAQAHHLAGDPRGAIALFERAFEDCVRVLGEDDPLTLSCGNNMAHAYKDAGDAQRAVVLFERTLAGRERLLGQDHLDTLESRHDLAGACQEAGDLKRAIKLHVDTLNGRRRVLGADHPDTLLSHNNLAGAYQTAGDLKRAVAQHRAALAGYQRLLPAGHPLLATMRRNLEVALTLRKQRDRAPAKSRRKPPRT
ncbi:FxSxx-COOH system tetratricopeptide repeat protein [Actinomadura fibrosa]|uniref:FxSxx-COOH system tetratricopeptide repeat protein n=1 Tax=Actinomadura fibrosa TaxID=111802 RepID=A0ABW2XU41_9ACTN|nr:FxSxx-COOH system tetratricopeptide repeat protein [Actinomadura fibrosa]